MERRTLAVVSFLPDPGHVRPLLRAAKMLAATGSCEVRCFLPKRFEAEVRKHGFTMSPLAASGDQWSPALAAELSRRSIFYNAFWSEAELTDRYWVPLRHAMRHDLAPVAAALRALQPQVILCDPHVFTHWYQRLASYCGAKLVFHRCEGTLRWARRRFVQVYGLDRLSEPGQRVVEIAGSLVERVSPYWQRLTQPHRRQAARQLRWDVHDSLVEVFGKPFRPPASTSYISAGLAVLEPRDETTERRIAESRELVLAPPPMLDNVELSEELRGWLAARKGRVVYVSFGTMVNLSEPLFGELFRGLADAGVPVIWSLPEPQHPLVEKYPLPENFRIEKFVPQPALLASGALGCFVSHAGAGSISEAAVYGTPVLCIPIVWDQPYNASLILQFGNGRLLPKRRVKRRRVTAAVRELLDDPRYAAAGARVAEQLRAEQGSERQAAILRMLLEPEPPAPSLEPAPVPAVTAVGLDA